MSSSIVIGAAAATELEPAPITPSWILSGTPGAQNKVLANSRDRNSYIMVWECTPGQFKWHYNEDETIVVISGEVFITNESGQERQLGPGNMAFFPAGSSCTWRITDKVRMVAVFRNVLPIPLALCLRVWNKLLQTTGWKERPAL